MVVSKDGLIKFFACYSLSLFYSTVILLHLGIKYVFGNDRKYWEVKERLVVPNALASNEHGEHKYVKVNDIKLHYVEKGDKTKPLMLFVHGFPEFWYSWRYQIKEFSNDYWTVAIDQRGYGESEKLEKMSDYHLDKMVEDIRQLVKHLGRDKFILCSHDFGAFIGWRFVVKHMDMLEKYIMIGSPSSEVWNKLVTQTWTQFKMSWYTFFFQMPLLPEFLLKQNDFNNFNKMEIPENEVELYKYTFSKEGALTGPLNYYRANAKFIFPDPPLKRPSHFVPGLYILGENDRYISQSTGKALQKYYDNLEFKIVIGANHFTQQHKPTETNRIIREFLSKT